MKRSSSIAAAAVVGSIGALLVSASTTARSAPDPLKRLPAPVPVHSPPEPGGESTAAIDTVWIADWSFDVPGSASCDETGWERVECQTRNDSTLFWRIDVDHDGTGGITRSAAIVGAHNLCWETPDGYDNDWYQGIRIEYTGTAFLSFDYLVDSESGYDFLQVELDEDCASYDRVDYAADPWDEAYRYRDTIFVDSGLNVSGRIDSLPVSDFGTDSTHCLYVAFWSDGLWSPADGLQPTTLGAALVIDNLDLYTPGGEIHEDFEGPPDSALAFVNMWESRNFGMWARLYNRPPDNDVCTGNPTCAWIFTDPTLPASNPDLAYGPSGVVTRPGIDNAIVSPWISLASSAGPKSTFLSYRVFGGNDLCNSGIELGWSVRGRKRVDNADTPASGDSVVCLSKWSPYWSFETLSFDTWRTRVRDVTSHTESDWYEMQVRLRVANFYCFGACPCTVPSGPGPYVDRVRVGRTAWCGPSFTNSNAKPYAQDAFPTKKVVAAAHEYFVPSTDRFGTCAFSNGSDRAWHTNPALILGDSITVQVSPECDGAPWTDVSWCGAIVAGPHAGKAPPPWPVGPNGFFCVPADTVYYGSTPLSSRYVDLDDEYFRGGDVVRYFWVARDANGGFTSMPEGLTGPPASVQDAVDATGGLYEVGFLPAIDWDPAYVQRIVADPSGKIDPTPEELANSSQANCILYAQQVLTPRRCGQRTAFMHTLDRLGYEGHYDVFDLTPVSSIQVGGVATLEQVTGYALIVHDTGNSRPFVSCCYPPLLSDGYAHKVDQAQWYRDWLAAGAASEVGRAALFLLGSNIAQEKPTNPLLTDDMGVVYLSEEQATGPNPNVEGVGAVTWASGSTTDFSDNVLGLDGGCPHFPHYDALTTTGTATVTHRFRGDGVLGEAAVIVNTDSAARWNTVMVPFAWEDVRDAAGSPPASAEKDLVVRMLDGVLHAECLQQPDPTDVPDDDAAPTERPKTALHQSVPNPFNPTTEIRFDLARDSHVELRIYDVAGRRVRTLVSEKMEAGFDKRVVWNGLDDDGHRVSSGVYVYRLVAGDYKATRKMVVMR